MRQDTIHCKINWVLQCASCDTPTQTACVQDMGKGADWARSSCGECAIVRAARSAPTLVPQALLHCAHEREVHIRRHMLSAALRGRVGTSARLRVGPNGQSQRRDHKQDAQGAAAPQVTGASGIVQVLPRAPAIHGHCRGPHRRRVGPQRPEGERRLRAGAARFEGCAAEACGLGPCCLAHGQGQTQQWGVNQ